MTIEMPKLTTQRLILRPFTLADVPEVAELSKVKEIAQRTLNLSSPYTEEMAKAWIEQHSPNFKEGKEVVFAIILQKLNRLCGAINLTINAEHNHAMLGYWLGKSYWGNGYCTEAGKAVLDYGFNVLKLNRIYANHIKSNPASGRVIQKLGMKYEGCQRQHIKRCGNYEDLEQYGILASDWKV